MKRCNASFHSFFSIALGLVWASGVPSMAAASITGVCPDGSIFIVQRPESIPCAGAKFVEPHEVPPIKPEYLPRPYTWEVFNSQQDPNNPYNLVDAARQIRATGAPPEADREAAVGSTGSSPRELAQPQVALAPPVSAAPPAPQSQLAELDLGLGAEEIRDLALLVELSQERAPASFESEPAGAVALRVRVAHSVAFETRLHEAWAQHGRELSGPVVLVTAEAFAPGAFRANLTLAQGHVAFHPDTGDPQQFGLLRGQLGPLAAGDLVLGYAVLPAGMLLHEPLDIYWNDHLLSATLRP